MTDELSEITFCDECPYSGEPNGCNRKGGVCRAHDYCFDLRDERDALKAENAELRERLEKTIELPFYQKDGEAISLIYKNKDGVVLTETYFEDVYYGEERGDDVAEARLAELNQK